MLSPFLCCRELGSSAGAERSPLHRKGGQGGMGGKDALQSQRATARTARP